MQNDAKWEPTGPSVRRTAGIVALAGAVALVGLAIQRMDVGRESAVIERPGTAAMAQGLSGMIVVRDAESGELRTPSGAESRQFLADASVLFDQSNEGLEGERMANGGWKLDLQGRHQNATVVVAGADGQVEVICAEHAGQVESAAHRALHRAPLDADGLETR